MSQRWLLSQSANKASGTCPHCKAVRQLHLKDGTLHLHGPRNNRCPDSGLKPTDIPPNVSASSPSDSVNAPSTATASSAPQSSRTIHHPPAWQRSIRHIPKPARSDCARKLTTLFNAIVARPDDAASWQALLDFGFDVLRCPSRGGKRVKTFRLPSSDALRVSQVMEILRIPLCLVER